jgi:hypothetical protein
MPLARPSVPRLRRSGGGPSIWWSCFEGAGTVIHDHVVGYNLSAPGARWAGSPVGPALSFDGSYSATASGYYPGLPTSNNDRSVILWLTTTAASLRYLWSYGSAGTGSAAGMAINSAGHAGQIDVNFYAIDYYTNAVVNDGKLHQVGYALNGTTIQLYVDGKLDSTYSGVGISTLLSPSYPFTLGDFAAGGYRLIGSTVVSLSIYNRAISPMEFARDWDDPWWRARRRRASRWWFPVPVIFNWPVTDSAAGTDGAALAPWWLIADTAAGAETISGASVLVAAEAGAGVDAAGLGRSLGVVELAAGTESSSFLAFVPSGGVDWWKTAVISLSGEPDPRKTRAKPL